MNSIQSSELVRLGYNTAYDPAEHRAEQRW